MGIIEEINKLHTTVQSVAIAFLFIMPIWYIDIFLFANNFFNTTPFYIPIVFSFALTTAWIIGNYFFSIAFISKLRGYSDTQIELEKDSLLLSLGIINGITLLSIFTIIYYLEYHYKFFIIFRNLTNYGIFAFIVGSFTFLAIMSLFITLINLFGRDKKVKGN